MFKMLNFVNKHAVLTLSAVHVHCIDVPILKWTKLRFKLKIYLQIFGSDSVRVPSQRFAQWEFPVKLRV